MTIMLTVAAVIAGALLLIAAISPKVLVWLIARSYPRGDARRDELSAELQLASVWGRFCWVLELVEAGVRDGSVERRKAFRVQRAALGEARWAQWFRIYMALGAVFIPVVNFLRPEPTSSWMIFFSVACAGISGLLFVREVFAPLPMTIFVVEDRANGRRIVLKVAVTPGPRSLRPTGQYRAAFSVPLGRSTKRLA